MIAFDLDGTTLQDDHETFSPRLISALEKAHEMGLYIIPSTGRPYGALPEALKGHPEWESYAVLANGEQLRDMRTGEVLSELFIPSHIPAVLYNFSKEFGLGCEFYIDGKVYLTMDTYNMETECPELEWHVSEVLDKDGLIVESLEPLLEKKDRFERVQLMCLPDWVRPILFMRLATEKLSALTSWMGKDHMEVTNENAHKGRGVKTLCQRLGIRLDEVLAFGDADNDCSMLRMSGLGIAMENGWTEAIDAADEVTLPSNEDGVAIAIEKHVLGM